MLPIVVNVLLERFQEKLFCFRIVVGADNYKSRCRRQSVKCFERAISGDWPAQIISLDSEQGGFGNSVDAVLIHFARITKNIDRSASFPLFPRIESVNMNRKKLVRKIRAEWDQLPLPPAEQLITFIEWSNDRDLWNKHVNMGREDLADFDCWSLLERVAFLIDVYRILNRDPEMWKN